MDLSRLDFSLFKKSEGAPKAPSEVSSQVGKSARSVIRTNESTSSSLAKNNPREKRKHLSACLASSGLSSLALDLGNLSAQLIDLRDAISQSNLDDVAINATRGAVLLTKSVESLIDTRSMTRQEKLQMRIKLSEVSKSLDVVRDNLKSKNDLFFEKQGEDESSAGQLIERSRLDVDLLKRDITNKIGLIKEALESPRPTGSQSEPGGATLSPLLKPKVAAEETKLIAEFIVNEGPKVISTQLMPDAEKLISILLQIEMGVQADVEISQSKTESSFFSVDSKSCVATSERSGQGLSSDDKGSTNTNPFVVNG